MNKVAQSLIKSLVGRFVIIAFLGAGVVACWHGADDFSRSFGKALLVLETLALLDAIFGVCVFAAFQKTNDAVEAPSAKIFASPFGAWCFVVFLPGSSDSANIAVRAPSGEVIRSEVLSLSRKLFCGPDALGRTLVLRLSIPGAYVTIEAKREGQVAN